MLRVSKRGACLPAGMPRGPILVDRGPPRGLILVDFRPQGGGGGGLIQSQPLYCPATLSMEVCLDPARVVRPAGPTHSTDSSAIVGGHRPLWHVYLFPPCIPIPFIPPRPGGRGFLPVGPASKSAKGVPSRRGMGVGGGDGASPRPCCPCSSPVPRLDDKRVSGLSQGRQQRRWMGDDPTLLVPRPADGGLAPATRASTYGMFYAARSTRYATCFAPPTWLPGHGAPPAAPAAHCRAEPTVVMFEQKLGQRPIKTLWQLMFPDDDSD